MGSVFPPFFIPLMGTLRLPPFHIVILSCSCMDIWPLIVWNTFYPWTSKIRHNMSWDIFWFRCLTIQFSPYLIDKSGKLLGRLDERKRRKNFILERNLLYPDPFEKSLSPEELKLCQHYKVFMRFHSKEEHKELLKCIIEEHRIVKRIQDLQVLHFTLHFLVVSTGFI